MCLPAPISILISMSGIVAGRADYENWLFSVLCTILDWPLGSYIKSFILFVGLISLVIAYLQTLSWCLFYEGNKKKIL